MGNSEQNREAIPVNEAPKEPQRDISTFVPEKHRKPGETAFAMLATMVGILGYYFAMGMTSENLSSPSVFPKIASVIIVLCGIICIYRSCKKEAPEEGTPNVFHYLLPKDVLVILILLLIYCLVLPKLHFIISSYAFIAIGMIYLHRGTYIWQSLAISAGAIALLVVIFRYVFLVILP